MKKILLFGLGLACFAALFLAPLASSSPDGLERVAEDKGFMSRAEGKSLLSSPFPDYLFPGVRNEKAATAAAGIAGTLVTFGLAWGIGACLKRKKGRAR